MSFVERIKVTDGTEVASVNASNQLEVAEANSNAIKTAVELIDNAISGSEMQVDIVASLPAGTNNIGDVDVLTVPAPLNVTGGGVESAALRVTIANDSTGVVSVDDNGSTLSVDDGGASLTVDGTVAATQSGTWNVTNVSGTVSLPTGASTAANQSTIITALQLLDNVVATDGSAALTQLYQVGGTDGTNAQILSTNASGHLNIADGGNSITVDGTVAISGTVPVSDAGGSLTVDGTVTANLAAGTNNIGDVDVLTVPAPLNVTGSGLEASALRVTIASDSTGVLSVDDNGSTLSIDDGGGSITVDGTVGVSGTVTVADGGGSLTVDGTVAATQSGTWNITNVSGTVSLPTGAATSANQSTVITALQLLDDVVVTDNAGFTDGTTKLSMSGYIFDEVAGTALTENDAAAARIDAKRAQIGIVEDGTTRGRYATVTATNALKVDGSAVTQPVSGTFWQATQPVSIASAVPVTDNSGSLTVDDGGTTLSIDDGGGTITVDGTVSITANSSVNVAQFGGTNVVNGGTAGTQSVGGIQAHDAAISGNNPVLIGAYANSASGPAGVADGDISRLWCNGAGALVIAGHYQTEPATFITDAVGQLRINADGLLLTTTSLGAGTSYVGKVRLTDGTTDAEVVPLTGYNAQAVAIVDGSGSQITSFGGGTQYTEGDTDASITGTAMMFETNTGTSALGVVSASNPLPISDNGTTLSIDDGGGIITVDGTVSITANSSVNLSQVGGNAVVTGGTNGTLAIGGIQAHDEIYSGNNPVVIGGVASSATPTAVAVGDVARLWTTTSGAVHIADGNSSITVDGTVNAAQSGTWNITNISGTVSLPTGAATSANQSTMVTALQLIDDTVFTDDAAFTIATSKVNAIGGYAVAHGSNPDAADAGDAGIILMNRHRIPFIIGGHPNLQSAEYYTTAAQTNDNVLPLISAGTKYVITGITVIANAANTVNVSVRIGFGASAVPTQGASGADAVTKVVLSHPNIPPGSGFSKGHAGGIVGIGGDGEDLYITCSVPTTGSLIVQVDYYTIES
jgi:hypothetical protein